MGTLRSLPQKGSGLKPLADAITANAAIIDKLVADIATLDSVLDTLVAKMNADFADVTNASVDYAAALTAMTSAGESADTIR